MHRAIPRGNDFSFNLEKQFVDDAILRRKILIKSVVDSKPPKTLCMSHLQQGHKNIKMDKINEDLQAQANRRLIRHLGDVRLAPSNFVDDEHYLELSQNLKRVKTWKSNERARRIDSENIACFGRLNAVKSVFNTAALEKEHLQLEKITARICKLPFVLRQPMSLIANTPDWSVEQHVPDYLVPPPVRRSVSLSSSQFPNGHAMVMPSVTSLTPTLKKVDSPVNPWYKPKKNKVKKLKQLETLSDDELISTSPSPVNKKEKVEAPAPAPVPVPAAPIPTTSEIVPSTTGGSSFFLTQS